MPKNAFAIALAACSFELQLGNDLMATVQVTPAGKFYPADGRALKVDGWQIDAASAQRVIERFKARSTPAVLDYEHQTLHKENNGQPAPAAGWFRSLEWRDGSGLFATVELTQKARDARANKEYLYFSPVFHYHPVTGEVQEVVMGALTNTPAIDDMEELTLLAAACFGATLEDDHVNLLTELIAMLQLTNDATEEQALAALNKRLTADPLTPVRTALGVSDDADEQTLVAACTALKTKADTATVDPAKFVPIAAIDGLKSEVAALSAQLRAQQDKDTDSMIAAALEDGRLLKPMESWARDLAKTNVAALSAYLDTAKPLAALTQTQTEGKEPVDTSTGLTESELAVCSNMGITAEQFKKAKGETASAAA